MKANTSYFENTKRNSKLEFHFPNKVSFNSSNEVKVKNKQNKYIINNYTTILNNKIEKDNDYIIESNTYFEKKGKQLNKVVNELIDNKIKNEIVDKDINEYKINKSTTKIDEYCDYNNIIRNYFGGYFYENSELPSLNILKSEKKLRIENESDFDINLKIYQKSNNKINNNENLYQNKNYKKKIIRNRNILLNKILIIYYLIIKYIFISII